MQTIVSSSSYNTAEYVLNLARSILDDASIDISGDNFSDDQPYTFVFLNSAYQYLQDELANNGVRTLEKETILSNITPAAVLDPATQVFIFDQGYNDGGQNHATPSLPLDLVMPLRLWERQTGSKTQFVDMAPANDGLPSISQSSTLRYWEWRNDGIYMVGATQSRDIRLRYQAYLPDLTDGTSQVQIKRATNALAYLTAAEYSAARGAPMADNIRQQADELIVQMIQPTIHMKQRGNHRRIPYSRSRGRR